MDLSEQTIQRIVADVLSRLGTGSTPARDAMPLSRDPQGSVSLRVDTVILEERIITADLLAERAGAAVAITVGPQALVTPAARDFLRDRGVELRRAAKRSPQNASLAAGAATGAAGSTLSPLLVVVRNTPAVERLWEELRQTWKRELLGCPDDAAKLAISALTRGESACVVILAEQSHRAACLANRNERVKAVALREAAEVRRIEKQLRTNVWCVDPTGLSYFEVKNLLRQCDRARGAN